MSSEHLFTRNTSSRLFADYCTKLGVDLDAMFQRLNLQQDPGAGFHYSSFNAVADLFNEIAVAANDPHFGINWALVQPDDFRHAGPVIHLASQVTSWRGFVEIGVEYLGIFTNGISYTISDLSDGHQVSLKAVVHPLARPCRQLLEHQFATIAQMAFRAVPDMKFERISFMHDGDPDHPVIKKAFGRPVEYNAEANILQVDSKYLDRKTLDASPLIKRGLKAYIKFQSRHIDKSRNSMSVAVAGLIPDLMGVKKLNLRAVAYILQISPKKLQRLLSEEGTSFSAILDNTRISLAVRYLTEMDMTLSQIARLLDYSSQETFIQAFHRWFGQTPSEFKTKVRSDEG